MNAVIFPGQGTQYVGMGKYLYENFPEAKNIFSYADNFFGINLSKICFFGEENLNDIYLQQLAIVTVSLAAYEVFKTTGIKIDFFSGLSLGEYTCLYPAQVLSLDDLLSLVKKRAEATQKAVETHPSCMLAVLGLEKRIIEKISQTEKFYLANINSSNQIVISLKNKDKIRIKKLLAGENDGVKVIEVFTGGGFHSPFMERAYNPLKNHLNKLQFNEPLASVISNISGRPLKSIKEIKTNTVEQLIQASFLKKSVEFMAKEGVDTFFEIGPGRVLKNLIKSIVPNVNVVNIEKKEDIENILNLRNQCGRAIERQYGRMAVR